MWIWDWTDGAIQDNLREEDADGEGEAVNLG